jgi:DNA-binding winged helix-turn-helix (wHTH) protein/Tfp pilus assembly protein PilF/TolB-like protein
MHSSIRSSFPDSSSLSKPLPGSPRAAFIYEFEGFRLDPANRLLSCGDKEVPLPGRAFDVLLILVQQPGALLTKEVLLASVWAGAFVEEANLTVAISTLRRALNEDTRERRYIQTVARQGYRFIAEVRAVQDQPRAALVMPAANPAPPEVLDDDGIGPLPQTEMAQPVANMRTRLARTHVWPVGVFAGIMLVALLVSSWLLLHQTERIQSLAVLPVSLDSAGKRGADSQADEIVSLGITDGLISRLDSKLIVRPTSSVLRYSWSPEAGGHPINPVAAGREQRVDAVLAGSMKNTSGQLTLKLRLIRTRDGLTLWQDSFDGDSKALPELELRAGDAATEQLRHLHAVTKPDSGTSVSAPGHGNDQAYQLYLRGRYFWNLRTVDGLHKSVDCFRQSIAADPNYALAYAGLADSYALLASFSVEPVSDANADARSAALSAIQLDPTLAAPHASLGMIYFYTDWNLEAAGREFERSIELNPNYATAHHWYGLDLAAMGRFPQALYEVHLAQKLDPLSLIIGTNVGWVEYLSRDYTGATRDLHRVLELDPNFARARARLGMVEMATGDNAGAIADLTKALELSGDDDPWVEGLLGDAEARAGNRAAAEHALVDLSNRATKHYVPPISRGLVLIGLGRKAEALTALSQAVTDHSTSMIYARVDPALDPVRDYPGFQELRDHIKP